MNNNVENDFFGFPDVTGEVDKSVKFHVKFSQNLTIIKIGQFLTDLFKKIKRWTFWDTGYRGL